ncbi:MAG TPA: magnesium transporter [Verrucomicrobiae bacterium]|nr:magnesium transporter [Verrucomicrobiae bacterium]
MESDYKELVEQLLEKRDFRTLRQELADLSAPDIALLIDDLDSPDDVTVFRMLPRRLATETFEYLPLETQEKLIDVLAQEKRRLVDILNDMSPDDRTALLEELPGPVAQRLLNLLKPEEREVAVRLLGYPEESIGRLMTPDYVAVRADWTVRQTLEHIRIFGKDSETLNVIYVIDGHWRLLDDLRIRELLLADPDTQISSIVDGKFVALKATDDQETAVQVFRAYGRVALPVTDSEGILLGIVTIDDVLVVAEEEATEDIQKIGGLEALDEPYLNTPLSELVKKRARWLVILFVGEMLTASAMSFYETEIARAVVLALFIPLIISSGGNSGSQAATLVIRAMAVGEITLADWWNVMQREIISGLVLGTLLGSVGFMRVILWQQFFGAYGQHALLIGLSVGISLIGVVLWGTLSGSMLPFVMKRLGADPATSSTPFVATLVDVTGLVIYFSVAALVLAGKLV